MERSSLHKAAMPENGADLPTNASSTRRDQIERGEMQKQQHLAKLERLRGEFKLHLLDRQAEIASRADTLVS
jgi:hypothetical protein